ncbi:MAG: 3-deoxy-D-manno-octulosonic acid transferase [Bacteroidetes bacterium]|nr:3-deoxy-D-manno-octulosonic acid transferase [Bacteroidota bacterium]MBU1484377.1 3-deoxy-D-manno-octulosonic acid transferase [Bacteroidota bacterium]MBU1760510.1 3-deoxy-D-manno-octulosonic acid transferase [Bacteroidota bacterium]MBU2045639.1 3-deoxy-D-manno-octulosonic acid transferase [Bacteroidota bacterium]MBU2268603.1 3-deoxy-D-manno-octulosonic acid transferase [Bacteroidota bacterium]
MPIIYHIGIKIYYFFILVVSLFNTKAKHWIKGRRDWRDLFPEISDNPKIWFHFASLGEFEQGKPLLQAARKQIPDKKIIITFFSPSGYEIRKNSALGDYILYLPIDSPRNAQDFIRIFNPELAIFNKYEYWYFFYRSLNQHEIPIYITSSIFRENQIFFKWYGSFNRKILSYVTHFFVQNKKSGELLESIGLKNFTLSGDTRFDSVLDLAKNKKEFPIIQKFKGDKKLIIAGSTWPEDEKLLANYHFNDDWKLIIAPHEISESKILDLERLFENKSLRYSKLNEKFEFKSDVKVILIDNIGMLSSLYNYGEIAYIGGGFGAGIHNTLEAAAWGLPVIFGANYQKFQEAKDLIKLTGGFTISNQTDLNTILDKLIHHPETRISAGKIASDYVAKNTGATEIIMDAIFKI